MSVDMRLISFKDGGKFAMSWIAGTNPKALRLNIHRSHMYTIDVPEVCENIMETIRCKEDKISFRVLFKLCFGTIHIFSEQVQHLYNVTQNFVCFNTFVLKQYSRKRTSSSNVVNNKNKKRRLESSTSMDITQLLLESETFNEYSEETFNFPKEDDANRGRKQNTSTCIEIKQITIRQVSWDSRPPDEEDMFGEASQDERTMLLSALCGSQDSALSELSSNTRKRKSSCSISESCSTKRWNGSSTGSPDHTHYASSLSNETTSEFSVESRALSSNQGENSIPDYNGNNTIQDELLSMHEDLPPTENRKSLRDTTAEQPFESIQCTDDAVFRKPASVQRKRRRPHRIIDKVTKLTKLDDKENNCYNHIKKEPSNQVDKFSRQSAFNLTAPSKKFQNRLLVNFKGDLKTRLKQVSERELIVEEILGDEYKMYESEFKLKSNKKSTPCQPGSFEENQMSPPNEYSPQVLADENNNCFQTDLQRYQCHMKKKIENENLSLKCSLDEIDLNRISFNFSSKDNQRSEWGKEGILMKLLNAWISKDPTINMKTIIVGASRINAALAFHTLLDLAGQQYIEILKDEHNAIESIQMGPEMVRKLNETLL